LVFGGDYLGVFVYWRSHDLRDFVRELSTELRFIVRVSLVNGIGAVNGLESVHVRMLQGLCVLQVAD
jgi:hypothetical protein